MEKLKLGPLTVWATGGEDRRGGGDGPAIILCHGFGAPGDDLVSLARVTDVDRATRWFFPEAPLEIDFGGGATGRAWWPIDMERLMTLRARGETRQLAEETPDGLASARTALEATIAALESERGLRRDRALLGGFSQGAMLATELVLFAQEKPFAGLAALSGTVISQERWVSAAAVSGPGLHAVVTHGRRDPILPFAGGEMLRDMLVASGATVSFVPHGGGHEIPAAALSALATLARERLR